MNRNTTPTPTKRDAHLNASNSLTGWWQNAAHAVGVMLMDQGNGLVVGALTGYGTDKRPFLLPFSGKIGEPLGLYHTRIAAWPPNGPAVGKPDTKEVGHITITVTEAGLHLSARLQWWVGGTMRPSPHPPMDYEERFALPLTKLV